MSFVLIIHATFLLTIAAQKNLTPFGQASQSSTLYANTKAINAIQPPISNTWEKSRYGTIYCTHTTGYKNNDPNNPQPAWWMFEFSFESAFITEIQLYYREHQALRMDGFELYVTNTSTIPPVGYLCYEDPDPGLPDINQTIPCNQLGKYVIYYDNKGSTHSQSYYFGPMVELCYVAIDGCQKSYWGSDCELLCPDNCLEKNCFPQNGSCVWGCNANNCLSDICDKDTSACTNGCKHRRTGIYCNSYNIAYDSSVWQDPSGSQPAEQAKDGDIKTCSKTMGSSVKFQVDLTEKSIVTGLFIILGEGTTKEGYHTVYASNTSNTWNNGTVLYNGTYRPKEINFASVFRFLTYVRPVGDPFAELELCEIGIIGCPPTHYGPLCNLTCPPNCKGPCDLDVGQCSFGCVNGWTGISCEEECPAGFYGKDCVERCSANCLSSQCHHVTGECIGGCKDGWQTFNCSQECPYGQFGRNCSRFCDGCISRMCNHLSGLCDNSSACNYGYKYSQYCNTACDDGNFGNNCANRCFCLTEPCSKDDGICQPSGCKEGWYGESCTKECNIGYYGRNCEEFCGGCISNVCVTLDGLCKNTTGCEPGYLYEEYCNTICEDGYFGDNCTLKCNCLTGTCDSFTGTCSEDGTQARHEDTSNAAAIGGGVAAFIIVVLILVAALIVYKRRGISTQDGVRRKSNDATTYENRNTTNNSNRDEPHYDDLIRMDTTSSYQDLTSHSAANEYEQIDNTYVNQSLQI